MVRSKDMQLRKGDKDLALREKVSAPSAQMNSELQEIQARYSALFDRSLECVYIHDLEGNFLDANKTLLDVLGCTKEELLATGFASMITEGKIS